MKVENSNKGLKGICKKVGYWIIIAILFFVALSFQQMGKIIGVSLEFPTLICWFTLATFIINEICSILDRKINKNKTGSAIIALLFYYIK